MCVFIWFWTHEIDSTPPAAKMSPSPVITRCAAIAIVCSPDEQKRLTVIPDVVTGQPPRSAICRAMLRPVAPSGLAQPMMTSSISAGSSRARSMAWRSAWPPRVAPCVMLNAPFQLLQSGVRAVETMTASGMPSLYQPSRLSAYTRAHERAPRRFVDGFIEQDARGVISRLERRVRAAVRLDRAPRRSAGAAHELIPERNRARHDKAHRRAFSPRPTRRIRRQEITALHRDGHEFRAEFALVDRGPRRRRPRDRDGGARDRRRTRAPKRRSARASASAPSSIRSRTAARVVDLRGNYLFVNDAFCRIFGFVARRDPRPELQASSQNPSAPGQDASRCSTRVYTHRPADQGVRVPGRRRRNLYVEQSISLERDADGRAGRLPRRSTATAPRASSPRRRWPAPRKRPSRPTAPRASSSRT